MAYLATPASSIYISNYYGTEDMLLYLPKHSSVAGRIPVIYAHGFFVTSGHADFKSSLQVGDDLRPVAGMGHPVAVPDLGGISTWGNDVAWQAIDATIAWLAANYGTRTDRIALWGDSMGGVNVLNWAMRYEDRIAAIVLRVPVVDLEAVRAYNDTFDAIIDDAYGGNANYIAALPTHNPAHPSQITKFRAMANRGMIFGQDGDIVVPPSSWHAFSLATGWPLEMNPGLHADAYHVDETKTTAFLATALNRYRHYTP